MKKLLTSLLIILSATFSLAQPSSKDLRKLDSFVEHVMSDWNVPGVSIGIVRGDEIIYTRGYGLADVESGRGVDENTLFAIGSSSKAFTAFSVLQLVNDKLVKLDEPVQEYLPDFRLYDEYVGSHLTVRDLLCHRSGLPRHDVVWYGAPSSREELFHKLQYLEPSAGFREYFQYQNLMYMTAGYLVGQLRHSTWEQEVKERIFDPLGMTRANFSVNKMQQDPNHALPYLLQEDELTLIEFRNIDAVGPAGSINASAREMCHWIITQIQGGSHNGKELLPASVLAQAHTPAMPVPPGWLRPLAFDNGNSPITYGLGWFISTHKGRKMLQHGGNIDGFSAMASFIPADSLGLVVLTNLNGNPVPAIVRNYILDMMLEEDIRDWNGDMLKMRNEQRARQDSTSGEEDLKRVKSTSPSHKIDNFAGTYSHPAYGQMHIASTGDSLDFKYNSIEVTMGHYHYDVFHATHPIFGPLKVNFHSDTDGNISHLSMKLEPSVDEIEFSRKPPVPDLPEEELEAFTGTFLIENAQRAVVSLENGSLKLNLPGQPVYTLEPIGEMKFNIRDLDGFTIIFMKNDDGIVNRMVSVQPNGQFTGERIED